MKKVCIAALAGAATVAVAAPAVAQTPPLDVQVNGSVKAVGKGKATPRKPKVVTAARTGFKANVESKKTVSEMRFYLPKTLKLSGKGFKSCSTDAIAQQGPTACPKGSKIGAGTASAVLTGGSNLNFVTQLFANGANKVTLYINQPDLAIQIPVQGIIKKSGLAPYGQVLTVPIPTSLQNPAPGLYAYITGVDTTINGKTTTGKGRKKKVVGYASLTGCPKDKKHHFGVQLVSAANDAGPGDGPSQVFTSTVPCKA